IGRKRGGFAGYGYFPPEGPGGPAWGEKKPHHLLPPPPVSLSRAPPGVLVGGPPQRAHPTAVPPPPARAHPRRAAAAEGAEPRLRQSYWGKGRPSRSCFAQARIRRAGSTRPRITPGSAS